MQQNLGHDSDTVAAIAGGLKGIEVGYRNIPEQFSSRLKDQKVLLEHADLLNEMRNKKQ
ncbi:ADP-ribosylglycohydrolase family protein [Ureibacillus sp. NPDC094379]